MKKVISLVLSAGIACLILSGCGSSDTGNDANETDESTEAQASSTGDAEEKEVATNVSGSDYWKDFYIEPNYDDYNSPAAENGLDGTLIRVTGTITDKKSSGDFEAYYLTTDDGNTWLLTLQNNNEIVPEVGDTITAYGDYGGQSSVFDDLPAMYLIRYTSGDDVVNITAYTDEISDMVVYPAYEDEPTEYVDNTSDSEVNGHYYITVELSAWDDLDYDKQCSIAIDWVEYYKDLFTEVDGTPDDFDINAYDENGDNAFIYDGGDYAKMYSGGEYSSDCPV